MKRKIFNNYKKNTKNKIKSKVNNNNNNKL